MTRRKHVTHLTRQGLNRMIQGWEYAQNVTAFTLYPAELSWEEKGSTRDYDTALVLGPQERS
jgi:hypothetical protein